MDLESCQAFPPQDFVFPEESQIKWEWKSDSIGSDVSLSQYLAHFGHRTSSWAILKFWIQYMNVSTYGCKFPFESMICLWQLECVD